MKEAYYFSHDANARHDPKIMKMFFELKAQGYGIYWVIIEMLRNEPEYKLRICDCNAIAYQSHSDSITVKKVIEDYDLFKISKDGLEFWSISLLSRMCKVAEKSEQARNSANKRWGNANAMRTQCDGNAIKESKVKEIKEKIKIPPSLEEVFTYCKDRKNGINAEAFINHYQAKGWMIGKNKMKDWRAAIRTWEQRNPSKAGDKFYA